MSAPAGLSREMCDMVIQTLQQVVGRELPDSRILDLDQNDECPEDLVRHLLSPDVGLHLIFLPEEYGGLGGGARDICRVSEVMAGVDLGLATTFLAILLGTDPILVGGTPDQKQKWLSRIATGEAIVAYGVTEPEAGSNVASIQTTAVRISDAEGNVTGYRINGAKQFITNGGIADIYTILAKTPDGPGFFVVERGTPGLAVGRHEDKHGIRSSNTTGVLLEDVEVPQENLLGLVEGQGLKQANAVFGYTRLMVGAFGLGAGQAAIDRALAYGKSRIQFGGPLVEKEGYLLNLLVEPWIDLAAGRAHMDAIALRIDEGNADMGTEGAISKYWCTEAGNRAADAAIQAHGGYGYTREYMVEKIRRDVRITTIYEGTSEIQRSIIAMYRWKETVRSKGAYYEEMAARMDALHGDYPEVGADLIARSLRALNTVITGMHQARRTRHQMVMFTFADMMSRCEVAYEFASRAGSLAAEGDASAGTEGAMSRVFAIRCAAATSYAAHRCVLSLQDADSAEAMLGVVAELLPPAVYTGLWLHMAEVGEHLKQRD